MMTRTSRTDLENRSRPLLGAFLAALLVGPFAAGGELAFRHHFVDSNLPGDSWGQTALVDVDGDKDLDFITGRSRGVIRWYEFRGADSWVRHAVTESSLRRWAPRPLMWTEMAGRHRGGRRLVHESRRCERRGLARLHL